MNNVVPMNTAVGAAVQQFLYREARYLDDLQLEEWLQLFAQDGLYWVPASRGQQDALSHLSLYYEDAELLRARVMRLRHPRTETMHPAPRTVHQVTNIELDASSSELITSRSVFTMVEYRLTEQRLFAGTYQHTLRRHGDDFRIVMKRVDILNCDADQGHVRLIIPF